MERILITQLGFIGDVILSTPVIGAVKSLYPDSEITVLTTELSRPLVEFHPAVTEAIGYDKRGADRGIRGFMRTAAKLRDRRFAKVFSLHRSIRTSLLHYAANIPERYGFAEAKCASLYSKTASRGGYDHDVLRNLAILKTVGLDPLSVRPEICVGLPPQAVAAAQSRLPQPNYLVIAPGSVWATKRWTVQGFSALARMLKERGENVVIIGGAADGAAAQVIERSSGALDLTGRLSLIESAAVIAGSRAVVTNDSAPLHLASAFKRPTVALFCSTVPEFGFGPWATRSEVIGIEGLNCRPCGRHGHMDCPTGTHACQTGITPDRVFAAVQRLLA